MCHKLQGTKKCCEKLLSMFKGANGNDIGNGNGSKWYLISPEDSSDSDSSISGSYSEGCTNIFGDGAGANECTYVGIVVPRNNVIIIDNEPDQNSFYLYSCFWCW